MDFFDTDTQMIPPSQNPGDFVIPVSGILGYQEFRNPVHDRAISDFFPGLRETVPSRRSPRSLLTAIGTGMVLTVAPGIKRSPWQVYGGTPSLDRHLGRPVLPLGDMFAQFCHGRIPFFRRRSWSIAICKSLSPSNFFKRSFSSTRVIGESS